MRELEQPESRLSVCIADPLHCLLLHVWCYSCRCPHCSPSSFGIRIERSRLSPCLCLHLVRFFRQGLYSSWPWYYWLDQVSETPLSSGISWLWDDHSALVSRSKVGRVWSLLCVVHTARWHHVPSQVSCTWRRTFINWHITKGKELER